MKSILGILDRLTSFKDEDLMQGERILIMQHQAWEAHGKEIVIAVACLAVSILMFVHFLVSSMNPLMFLLPTVFFSVTIFMILDLLVSHYSLIYAATTSRVMKRTGIFTKRIDYVMYGRVQNVTLKKSIAERIADVGDIYIDVAGGPEVEMKIDNIKDPEMFQRLVLEYMEKKDR